MFIVEFHLKKILTAYKLGKNIYHNINLSFSDGSSSLSNIDGSNSSSSSGMYGKWGVSSSATLPSSSSAGIGTSSSSASAAATMAVGSLTLGTGSQLQSTQGTRGKPKTKYFIKDIISMFIAKSYHLHIFLSYSQRCKYSI